MSNENRTPARARTSGATGNVVDMNTARRQRTAGRTPAQPATVPDLVADITAAITAGEPQIDLEFRDLQARPVRTDGGRLGRPVDDAFWGALAQTCAEHDSDDLSVAAKLVRNAAFRAAVSS